MLSKGGRMAAELVNVATSEKLKEMDWTKNIEICELVVRDPGQGKHVTKSVKKRLQHKHPNAQLFAVMLLEMLLNNCGEYIHKQVIDHGLLPIMVKIVKKKTELPVRERVFLLLDATQTALGGASGKFPQYYAAYYDIVSAKVQFPQRPNAIATNAPAQNPQTNNVPDHDSIPPKLNTAIQQSTTPSAPDSSIIQKARSVLEVLQEVLNALDPQNPKGASDEFTLDLVEQCSFQKQRVMHLVMTSRDEKIVSQAIELNEQLHNVLTKHDALLSVHSSPDATFINHQEEPNEEEDLDRLLHRLRKGKACAEVDTESSPNMFRSNQWDNLQRPHTRSLCIEPTSQNVPNGGPRIPAASMSNGSSALVPGLVSIPPPPAKHIEREKFFKENKDVSSGLARHMRGLSFDSRNGSSSYSGSTDFSDRDTLGFRD